LWLHASSWPKKLLLLLLLLLLFNAHCSSLLILLCRHGNRVAAAYISLNCSSNHWLEVGNGASGVHAAQLPVQPQQPHLLQLRLYTCQ
jgi:hypothetical protein